MPHCVPHSSFRLSNLIRYGVLFLLALVPLTTIYFKNDRQEWTGNHALMAAPDEFSYMLTAESLLHGHGISTQKTLGLDTFYPPGYPILLALWSLIVQHGNVTPFAAHVFNALLLSAATIVVYFFAKRLLLLLAPGSAGGLPRNHQPLASPDKPPAEPGANEWLAILIASIFATNWHVLEGAFFVFSEPAFTLATCAWLALTLRWPNWHLHPHQALLVALLAIASWSIRGAGIVCIAVTLLVPLFALLFVRSGPFHLFRRFAVVAIILFVAVAYQLALAHYSPGKSLFASAAQGGGANSYPHQFLRGITARGHLQFSRLTDWPDLLAHNAQLTISHLDDFARSFTPWLHDSYDAFPCYLVGRIFALLALTGFVRHLLLRHKLTPTLNLFLILYFALYLLWPFNMPRFWAPILPIMLVLIADTVGYFCTLAFARRYYATLLALLLALNASVLFVQLGDYQRRINNVSDALATAVATVVKHSDSSSPPIVAVAGDSERFVFAWYLSQIPGGQNVVLLSPSPVESIENFLIRMTEKIQEENTGQLFIISYFTETYYPRLFSQFANVQLHPLFQRERITTVWQVLPHEPSAEPGTNVP